MESAAETPEPTFTRSRGRRRWVRIAAIVGVLIVVAVLSWRHQSAQDAPAVAPVMVSTATAMKGEIGVYLDAIGTVTPVYTDSITSQVNGVITAVHYKEAQLVRKGDPLIEIDARPYRANLVQAQGVLERDEHVLAQARMDLERYRAASARNAVAEQLVADQEKLLLQDEGTVKHDQGTVQYAELQVEYCRISAPISGRVGLRLVDPGNVASSSNAASLAVITQLQPITVIFTVPEESLRPVEARLHAKATLTVDTFDRTAQTKIATGELLALDNQIDRNTGTVKARALFDNKSGALFPNQLVNTRLLVSTLQGVTLVRASAIQHNGQGLFVYLIQNNTFVPRLPSV